MFTNSNSSLLSAINSSACSDGCVIEHAANFSSFLKLERTSGTGEIVIRPPIGRRGDYAITGGVDISGSNIVVAGFMHNGGHMFVVKGTNSGFAWSDTTNSAGVLGVEGYKGVRAEGFFYEVIERNMFNGSDRFYARYGGGGHTESLLVGCVLTGGKAAPPSHSDTIQIASDGTGGSGFVTVRDSVLWPSWDKVLQGEGSTYQFDLDNTWVVSTNQGHFALEQHGAGDHQLHAALSHHGAVDLQQLDTRWRLFPRPSERHRKRPLPEWAVHQRRRQHQLELSRVSASCPDRRPARPNLVALNASMVAGPSPVRG